jgi:hypothetical protein
MTANLTEGMKKTLLQIGYGVFVRDKRYYSDDDKPVDLRSANALLRRGLIFYSTNSKGSQLCGALNLTRIGDEKFEQCLENSRGDKC